MRSGHAESSTDLSRRAAICLMFGILLGAAALRIRLLPVPLERDEGEYAYVGWQMLRGVPPYSEAFTMKLPGIHAAYASILALFGHSATAIRGGLLLLNLATVGLVYLIGRQLLSRLAGVLAAAVYAVLSIGSAVHGFMANAEHFVILPMLCGMWFLLRHTANPRRSFLAAAGFCLGLAFLVKQPAVLFLGFGLLWLIGSSITKGRREPRPLMEDAAVFLAGPILLFAGTCLWMKLAGSFENFWLWTVVYPQSYASQVSWAKGAELFLQTATPIAIFAWPSLVLAVLGTSWSLRQCDGPGEGPSICTTFLPSFGVVSFLAVCPGFYFREHYFLFLLPAVALLAGVAIDRIARGSRSSRPLVAMVVISAALGWSLYSESDVLFRLPLQDITRRMYGLNPFPESPAIAEHIARTTPPDARVAVLGSEPQFLFEAQRRSATGFLYMYPLTERHPYAEAMQRQMIAEIEAANPELVVVATVPTSWLYKLDAPRIAFDWMNAELPRRYAVEGLAIIGEDGPTRFLWGNEAEAFASTGAPVVKFLRRRKL